MIKRLSYIFIPIFAVLLMSHNVGAIPVGISFDDIKVSFQSMIPPFTCSINGSAANMYLGWCYTNATGNIILNEIKTDESIDVHENDYIEFDLIVRSENNFPYSDGYYLEDANAYDRSGFRLLSRDLVTDLTLYSNYLNITSGTGGTLSDGNYFYHIYHYVYKYVRTDTRSVQLGLLQVNAQRGIINAKNGGSDPLSFRLGHILVYQGVVGEGTADAINNQQKQETQNAANNSQSSGSSSSTDASSATSSLLSVIGAGVGAITTASPTNCKINGNMGNLNIGNIDLCANPVPSFIAVIGSIIAVLVVLPLVIVLFNRFISIFRSFQG